jgi:hypothetical protein
MPTPGALLLLLLLLLLPVGWEIHSGPLLRHGEHALPLLSAHPQPARSAGSVASAHLSSRGLGAGLRYVVGWPVLCGLHPDPHHGRRLTGNFSSNYGRFCRFTRGRNDSLMRGSVLSPGAATVVDLPEALHVGTGGRRGQHPPAPLSGFMREQRPENRGAAVCVDCESNKEKVSQRLPHSGIGGNG